MCQEVSIAQTCVGECHISYGTDSIDANVTFKPDHIVTCLGLQLYMNTVLDSPLRDTNKMSAVNQMALHGHQFAYHQRFVFGC